MQRYGMLLITARRNASAIITNTMDISYWNVHTGLCERMTFRHKRPPLNQTTLQAQIQTGLWRCLVIHRTKYYSRANEGPDPNSVDASIGMQRSVNASIGSAFSSMGMIGWSSHIALSALFYHSPSWFIDLGASNDMTFIEHSLDNIVHYAGREQRTVGKHLSISGIGSIRRKHQHPLKNK